MLVQNQFTI